jgi:putative acetyltransferase
MGMDRHDITELRVIEDTLSGEDVQALVAFHLADMARHSPACKVHALPVAALRRPDVTFWSAWQDTVLCGCGALKELDAESGEVKSMRTRPAFLRQGVGQELLDEIVRTARGRNYARLFLETGTGDAFAAAHALYLRNGFSWCGPFGEYEATEFNVFMVKRLPAACRRRLTLTSRWPPTAGAVWPPWAKAVIVPPRPASACLRGRLGSNVRRHRCPPQQRTSHFSGTSPASLSPCRLSMRLC